MKGALASSRTERVGSAKSFDSRPIKLMIVDDSMVARAVLSRMIASDEAFEIAAVAGTAEDAIEALGEVRVDIVLLDLEMPGAGGLKSIPGILKAARGAQVLIVSSLAEEGAEETVAALAMGAADTLPKPGISRFNGRFSEVLLSKLHALGHSRRVAPALKPRPARLGSEDALPLREMAKGPLELVAIGASTGGIHALAALFGNLPQRIGAPILVTQHLPSPFMPVFARQLGVAAGREASIAEDGTRLRPDQIYIAPGDAHLTVELIRGQLVARLTHQLVSSGCMPSVDPMFTSAARALGAGVIGVVLTGMGRDGTEGSATLVASGGSVLAQDEKSCAVWGMPRVVAEAGLACAIYPPAKIASSIARRAEENECR